jgi:hypothetical protein
MDGPSARWPSRLRSAISCWTKAERNRAGRVAIGRGQWPFTFRVWQREQGLPQNFVRALAQTKDGYVWVGSDAGVSRFDGARFVSFGLPEGFQAGFGANHAGR